MGRELSAFGNRLRGRVVRVLDVVSILVLDFAIIGVGYGLVRLLAHFANSGSRSFDAARKFSEGLFLVMYLAWVALDLWDYFGEEYRRRKQAAERRLGRNDDQG
jgi:hypothetical protein